MVHYLLSIHMPCLSLFRMTQLHFFKQCSLQGQLLSACNEQRDKGFINFHQFFSSNNVKSINLCLIRCATLRIIIYRQTYQLFGVFLNFLFCVFISENLPKQDYHDLFLACKHPFVRWTYFGRVSHSISSQGTELFAVRQFISSDS